MRRQLHQLHHTCPGSLNRSAACGDSASGAAVATAASFTKYCEYSKRSEIEGWVHSTILVISYHLAQYQHSRCMRGSVVEIGVHHGKHLLGLAAMAAPGEKALAVDLFEDAQGLNVDASGSGNRGILLGHAQSIGLTNVHTLAGDSMAMTIHNLSAYLPVRAFSVDGGHHAAATLSDMLLASCAVGRGGYFMVDDFINVQWLGVVDGVFRFMHAQRDFGPFFWGCNKVFFAHRDVHAQYLAVVKQLPFLRCSSSQGWHHTRYALHDYELCMHMSEDCSAQLP